MRENGWGFRTWRSGGSKWQLLLLHYLLLLKAVYQDSWAPLDKNKGWDLSRGSSVSARSAQALHPPGTCSLIWFRQRTTMWMNWGHQLCRMFFSLHVVFLSVAIMDSSASSADQKGKRHQLITGCPLLHFIGAFPFPKFRISFDNGNMMGCSFGMLFSAFRCLYCCCQTAWDPVVWSTAGHSRSPPWVWCV